MFEYKIGGNNYIQKPLVLGQIRQLTNLLQGVLISPNADIMSLVASLGDKLSQAIAISLIPEGVTLRDKDNDAISAEIEFEISPEQAIEVIEDFFSCNPIVSLLKRLDGTAEKIAGQISKGTTLKKSASSSPEATLQKETPSSGDIPLPNANPI